MISRFVPIVAVLSMALFTGCGGDTGTGPGSDENPDRAPSDGTTPEVGFETLMGTYAGAFTSTSQGFDYAADVTVDFRQHVGNLSGSSTIAGTLTSGMQMFAIQGTSNFTGTIDPGLNPSVNITFVSECPGLSALFTGTFDSEAQLLTISGPAHILVDCEIVLTFQSMVLMERVVPLEDDGS